MATTRTFKVAGTALVAMLATLGWPVGNVLAHEGHPHHKAMGVVASVNETQVSITLRDGREETFALTPETTYTAGKAAATRDAVKVGSRIVVIYEEEEEKDGHHEAEQVMLPPSSAAKAGMHSH